MKKIAAAATILLFALAGTLPVLAADRTAECKIESIEGKTVVLDCGKDAELLEEDSPVKVTPEKKKTAIEGC